MENVFVVVVLFNMKISNLRPFYFFPTAFSLYKILSYDMLMLFKKKFFQEGLCAVSLILQSS